MDRRPSLSMTWPQYLRGECILDGKVVKAGHFHRTGRSSQFELLTQLLMRRGEPVPTSHMIQLLWPDPEDEGSYAISYIRKLIGRLRNLGIPIKTTHRDGETCFIIE